MKLLLVCEHTLLREGLRHLLLRLDNKIKIFEAADFGQALDVLHSHDDISLTLLSSQLSDFDSWAALEILREHHAKVPVVLLSEDEDYGTVRRALVAGAQGFISRSASGNLLMEALRSVLAGEIYVPPESAIRPSNGDGELKRVRTGSVFGYCRLTQRQLDVLALIKNGKSNKEIAESLALAEGTVKIHCMAIFRELGVNNRTQAALRAEQILA